MYDKAHKIFNFLLRITLPKGGEYDKILRAHYYLFRSEQAFHKQSYFLAASWARLARRNLWGGQCFHGNSNTSADYDELLDLLENIQSYCNAQFFER